MSTARKSSRLGGLHQAPPLGPGTPGSRPPPHPGPDNPQDQVPLGSKPPPWDEAHPRDQAHPPPGPGTPPPGPGTPRDQAPLLWTESQTPVKTLPSRNFVCGR